MKTAIVFLVLLATVFCRPAKRPASSSESSEEAGKPAIVPANPEAAPNEPAQSVATESDEDSDESQEPDQSSESEESNLSTSTAQELPAQTTETPVFDDGRGDNLGYPNDYKKSLFIESNKIEKGPSPYKSHSADKFEESANLVSKKSSIHENKDGNNVEKTLKVYKALQLVEDSSTPEGEGQGLDASGGVVYPESESQVLAGPGEQVSNSASAAEGSEDSSESSEENTATPSSADSDSSQSSESQEGDSAQDTTTEMPIIVITAK